MFKAPAIYFPSTVILLDDDHLYAKKLIEKLNISGLKYCESPDFLLKQKNDDFLFIDNDIFEKININELSYLKKKLNTIKNTGKLISVLVSDLYMDSISGTEIFTEISSNHLGRILISNFVDFSKNNDITQARDDKHIDIVLDKTKALSDRLPIAIEAAKMKFFTSLSNVLFNDLGNNHPLSNSEFAKLFTAKIRELKPNKITPNSTLNKFFFEFEHTKTNQVFHITEPYEINSIINSHGAESAPKEVLEHLSSGKYILCNEDDDILLDGKLWPLYIRPAKEFNNKKIKLFYNISESFNYG